MDPYLIGLYRPITSVDWGRVWEHVVNRPDDEDEHEKKEDGKEDEVKNEDEAGEKSADGT